LHAMRLRKQILTCGASESCMRSVPRSGLSFSERRQKALCEAHEGNHPRSAASEMAKGGLEPHRAPQNYHGHRQRVQAYKDTHLRNAPREGAHPSAAVAEFPARLSGRASAMAGNRSENSNALLPPPAALNKKNACHIGASGRSKRGSQLGSQLGLKTRLTTRFERREGSQLGFAIGPRLHEFEWSGGLELPRHLTGEQYVLAVHDQILHCGAL